MVTGDFSAKIAIETFQKVGAGQLRCGAVRLESPQQLDMGRVAAIGVCDGGDGSAD
jgi:hypothetical protein